MSERNHVRYNGQSERIGLKDQNGTAHEYIRDGLGRETDDCVTVLGAGIDGAVRRRSTMYDIRGLVDTVSCYSSASVGSGAVLNQVKMAYNDFRQLTDLYLQHDGAVNVATSPKIATAYASGAGGSNQIRPTSVCVGPGQVNAGDSADDANCLKRWLRRHEAFATMVAARPPTC